MESIDSIDSFVYESDDPRQGSFNSSKHFTFWPNLSLAILNSQKANELLSSVNPSWKNSSELNETEQFMDITNEINPTTVNWLDSTTHNSNTIIDGGSVVWWKNWDGIPYPSGYTQLSIVVLAFFITCIMILIVVGNMLVCIAIATEKSLKPVQNWFIASLAVSDFLLGLIIMPFSLARELMGYWMFGQLWCDIHAALDVLLCTASINNLFMISLDRYWSVTQAVKYLKKRTPSRAALMIAFVWIFSALVSLPPLVGWKKPEKPNDYPQCDLSDDIGYVLYSASGSFYFPAAMMVFVYARIFVAARSRARRHLQQKRLNMPQDVTNDPAKEKSTTTTTCTSLSNPSPPDQNKDDSKDDGVSGVDSEGFRNALSCSSPAVFSPLIGSSRMQTISGQSNQQSSMEQGNSSVVVSPTTVSPPQIVIEAIAEADSSPHSSPTRETPPVIENNLISSNIIQYENSDLQIKSEPISIKKSSKLTIIMPEQHISSKTSIVCPKQNGSATKTIETCFITNDEDSDAIESPVSKETHARESKFLSAPKLTRSPYGSTLSIADYDDSDLCIENSDDDDKKSKKKRKGKVQYQDAPAPGRHTPSDAERHRRKIAKARERRATLILGLIMAAFIIAWLPFFVLYVLSAICDQCKPGTGIPQRYFSIAFWLGYCNSAANPIIYTIFNRDFRKAFRKILFK